LYHKKYIDDALDENLISGFLSAVHSFVSSFGAEIKWIEANKFRFVFHMGNQLMFVACTNLDELAPQIHKRLIRLADHFFMIFDKGLFNSCDPIPIDIFKKIGPTVNRLFGQAESQQGSGIIPTTPTIANMQQYRFDSAEAKLMSFIRYKRRVSIRDIVRFLKHSDIDVQETIERLEKQNIILRSEQPDGSEHFGINPIVRSGF
jgi:hypothetical protein